MPKKQSASTASKTAPKRKQPEAPVEYSSDSGSDSDVEEVELTLDDDGRVDGVAGTTDFATRVYLALPELVSAPTTLSQQLHADCERLFTEESFWVGAQQKPKNALERLALDIFNAHTKDLQFDPRRSGVEWWVQLRTGGNTKENITFHFDKDEDLVDQSGINVYPHLSTVTYFTDCGAPTLILDQKAGVDYEDTSVLYGPITTGEISAPRLGKHLVFDGQKLHGAPSILSSPTDQGRRRITFLANVWLNYQPIRVEPLPSVRGLVSVAAAKSVLQFNLDTPLPVSNIRAASWASHEFPFGPTGKEHMLVLPLPSVDLLPGKNEAEKRSGTFKVTFPKSTAGVSAQAKPTKKAKK